MDAIACEEDEGPTNMSNLPPAILHAVFAWLGPRDLCTVSCTCILWRKLNRDHVSNSLWKSFYTSKWSVAPPAGDDVCWQSKFGSKMKQGKCWTGKYEHDSLYGHKAGVKALKLLPSHGMLVTGSLDRTVRLWDLKYGMPLSISRAHGGTVRSVALDSQLVASGSSDNVVRLWHAHNSADGSSALDPAVAAAEASLQDSIAGSAAGTAGLSEQLLHMMEMDGPADLDGNQVCAAAADTGFAAAAVAGCSNLSQGFRGGIPSGHGPYSVVTGEADDSLFDLALPGQALRGHIGPVTSLCLTDSCLYSGSWDYTVRCWRRGSWDCISVLKYQDWVWGVVARGGLLLVASGPEVHVHDLPTGKLVRKFQNLHEGSVSCVEGTHSGKMLFSGGADGLLMAHDLRMKESSRVLWHHNAGVHGLAMEDPWLVSAASDGTVVMHNYEVALPNNLSKSSSSGGASSAPSRRTLHAPSLGPLYCVDMADSWLAAGGEAPAVHTWDFTKAAEAAARAAAAKAARNSAKQAAKQRRAAAAAARAGGTAEPSCNGKRSGVINAGAKKGNGGSSTGNTKHGHSSEGHAAAGPAASGLSAGVGPSCAAAAGSAAADHTSNSANGNGSSRPRGLLAAAAAAARALEAPVAVASSSVDRYHCMQHARSQPQQQRQRNGSNNQQRGSASCVRDFQEFGSSPQQQWYGYGSSPQQHWHGAGAQQYHHWHVWYGGSPQQQQQQHWHGHSSSPQQQWAGTSPASRWHSRSNTKNVHKQTQQQRSSSSSHSPIVGDGVDMGIPIPNGASGSSSSSSSRPTRRQAVAGSSIASETAAATGMMHGSITLSSSPGCVLKRAAHGVGAAGYRVPYSSSYPAAGQPSPWLVGSSPRFEVVLRHERSFAEKQTVPDGDSSTDAAAALAAEFSAPGSLSN